VRPEAATGQVGRLPAASVRLAAAPRGRAAFNL